MPAAKSTEYVDGLFTFEKGMNQGEAPLLLKRNQAALLSNMTVRGSFASNRPAFIQRQINYAASIQAVFEQGLFQGAGFFQPDVGNACLIASVSGRLFQFQLTGNVFSATEVSIPGDFNSASAQQSWMWQSESWMIVNDGFHLPIFYNGAITRRSGGTGSTVATTNMNATSPAIGSTVSLSVAAGYTGPIPASVYISGFLYVITATNVTAAGAQNVLTPLYSGNNTTIANGTTIQTNPNAVGINIVAIPQGNTGVFQNNPGTIQLTVSFAAKFLGSTGQTLNLGDGNSWNVSSVQTQTQAPFIVLVTNANTMAPHTSYGGTPVGFLVTYFTSLGIVTIGQTTGGPYAIPAPGNGVTVSMTGGQNAGAYTGPPGAYVFSLVNGTQGIMQFSIVAVSQTGGGGTTLTALNQDQPSGQTISSGTAIVTGSELPAGRMGAYGMGRNWMSLTDGRSYIGSDIVGSSSGSSAFGFRDAVLKVTQNNFLATGGLFIVPGDNGDIRAMIFPATLDTSLGQGPLQIFTPLTVFSNNAPVDNTTWQTLTNPIETESMPGTGALSQNGTVNWNSDCWFRSPDGERSLVLGRREDNGYGNTPQSFEVSVTLANDNPLLLNYGSAIVFDNRLIFTASPQGSGFGIYHPLLVALNGDGISALYQKTPPCYDGIWSGLNVLQLVSGLVAGAQRAFAFVLNTHVNPNRIEMWELLTDGTGTADVGLTATNPIVQELQSASLFKELPDKGPRDYCRLNNGELSFDEVTGPVTVQAFFRPDQSPNWTPWLTFTLGGASNFYPACGLGEPPNTCDPLTNRPIREGYTFQVRLVITGSCRFLGGLFRAEPAPIPTPLPPVCKPLP